MSRRVYIALFAVLVELVAVAASGNQGVTNFVADHMATSPLGDLFLRSLPSFPWRVTTLDQSGATTLLVSQYAAIATFLVLSFLLILIIVRAAPTFSGPFFGSLCAVVLAGLVAHMVANIVDYDWDGRRQHTGLGRFGYSLFNSNNGLTIMFSLMCGVVVAIVVGFVGVVLRRRTPEVVEPLFVAGAGLAGPGGYGPQLDVAGFGPADYAPPTQPWQTTENYEPVGVGGPGAGGAAGAAGVAADDPSLASYAAAPRSEPSTESPSPYARPATDPRAEWVPPPQPHPSFAYPPSYETGPLAAQPSPSATTDTAVAPASADAPTTVRGPDAPETAPAEEPAPAPAAEPVRTSEPAPTIADSDMPELSESLEPSGPAAAPDRPVGEEAARPE